MKGTTQTIDMPLGATETATPERISPWCLSKYKRLFDIGASSLLLVLISPLMMGIALLVWMTSRGPVFFRQDRVGRGGKNFSLLKFRTMVHGRRNRGLALTHQGDSRVTSAGRFLRKFKLDELPQLINVVRGDMSLVGPRPDVLEYYKTLDPEQQQVLFLRPGATGASTLQFRNEEALLAQVPHSELLSFYTGTHLPKKIGIDLEYARQATFFTDLWLLVRTVRSILFEHTSGEKQ
jgi:lipopolysaccharide/colanic/teichoic acid biosynthesis glycosyltransferase